MSVSHLILTSAIVVVLLLALWLLPERENPLTFSAPKCTHDISGTFDGELTNETLDQTAPISALFSQREQVISPIESDCLLEGRLMVHAPMKFDGRLSGAIVHDGFEVTVAGELSGTTVEMVMQGFVDEKGILQGSFTVPATNEEESIQVGHWTLAPS
jgi:hypothetical protein